MQNHFEELSLSQLKEMAKEKGLKGFSSLRKQELAERLQELETAGPGRTGQPQEPKAADKKTPVAKTPEAKEPAAKAPAETENAAKENRLGAEKEEGRAREEAEPRRRPERADGRSQAGGENRRRPERTDRRSTVSTENRRRPEREVSRSQETADGRQRPEREDGRSQENADGRRRIGQESTRRISREDSRGADNQENRRRNTRDEGRGADNPENRRRNPREENWGTENPENRRRVTREENRGTDNPENRRRVSRDDGRNQENTENRRRAVLRSPENSEERPRNEREEMRGTESSESLRPRSAAENLPNPEPQERGRATFAGWNTGARNDGTATLEDMRNLDSGVPAHGILEVMAEGYGFIRSANYLPGENDVYVSPSQIRRFNMKTGDVIQGNIRVKTGTEKFAALLYVRAINDEPPEVAERRGNFEDLTPVFPKERLHLETEGGSVAMRIVDLLSPIGKGQRGMIVSPPKAGKTTLLKEIAHAVKTNHPAMHIIILLIDERPEEVTDIKESIEGDNVEVIYSTFDEMPEHHKRVSEMVLERAKRLVEHGRDVMILLDSITRLARAYNLTVAPSGRTLSGGLDPAALYMPKKFFGAARCMREGGSLTVLATALVDTGSRMDDVVFEEFKGTGNMELVLDRRLSERRIFPAIDILKSGTRRDDLLLSAEEQEAVSIIHRGAGGMKQEEAVEEILRLFVRTKNNRDFISMVKKIRL